MLWLAASAQVYLGGKGSGLPSASGGVSGGSHIQDKKFVVSRHSLGSMVQRGVKGACQLLLGDAGKLHQLTAFCRGIDGGCRREAP